jgi:hypothetical protein
MEEWRYNSTILDLGTRLHSYDTLRKEGEYQEFDECTESVRQWQRIENEWTEDSGDYESRISETTCSLQLSYNSLFQPHLSSHLFLYLPYLFYTLNIMYTDNFI